MGIGKKNTSLRQPIQVRRDGLRMPTKTSDPVIQIIHRDENYIGRSDGLKAHDQSKRKRQLVTDSQKTELPAGGFHYRKEKEQRTHPTPAGCAAEICWR